MGVGTTQAGVLERRREACGGAGSVLVEMHLHADVYVPCQVCREMRYSENTLQLFSRGKSIRDVLDTLIDVGLEYIALGQSATTFSGGEAQRIWLSRELARRDTGRTFDILDEPTTGLHFEDVRKLLGVLNRLVERGNTVVVIEHNPDVIKTADHVIDLGPEGGDAGGRVIATGTPEELARSKSSDAGRFLQSVLEGMPVG